MKNLFNKILSFFGFKKDKKEEEVSKDQETQQLLDIITKDSIRTSEIVAVTLTDTKVLQEKAEQTGKDVKTLIAEELAERDKLTTEFMKDKAGEIISLNERLVKAATPDEPVSKEVKTDILTFDREHQTFVPTHSAVQEKVLRKVDQKIDQMVQEHIKTKDNSIEGLELLETPEKKTLVEKKASAKRAKSKAKGKQNTEEKVKEMLSPSKKKKQSK